MSGTNVLTGMSCTLPQLYQLTLYVACSRGKHGWLE